MSTATRKTPANEDRRQRRREPREKAKKEQNSSCEVTLNWLYIVDLFIGFMLLKVFWPSGLRRQLKVHL